MSPLTNYLSSALELTLPSGRAVTLSTYFNRFKPWRGAPIQDTYGHKPVVDHDGEPLFAELAIVRLVQADGWQGVWIDTYRKKFRQSWPDFCQLPSKAQDFLDKANRGRKWPAGCFDVLAWRDDHYLFVESKRRDHDKVKAHQKRWLESAINTGIAVESFSIFEWSFVDAN